LELLALEVVSVQKVDEALCHLEKVTVRFKRREFNVELEGALGGDLLLGGLDVEGVLYELASGLVHHVEQGPVDAHGVHEFISNRNCFGLANSTIVGELEVY